MRAALGDAYVDALRQTYAVEVADNADLVMYWWNTAAKMVKREAALRFGLISTNSITQSFNRRVLERHLGEGLRIVWAIPDHPWTDAQSGAAVRIAMTVARCGDDDEPAVLVHVQSEVEVEGGDASRVTLSSDQVDLIGPDLRSGAKVSEAVPLKSNSAIASMGVALHGSGFVVDPVRAAELRGEGPSALVPYIGGRDLLQECRERFLIDFSFLSEEEARSCNPAAFQHVLIHVKPERDPNRREQIRRLWWRFGWERPVLRKALAGISRYVATTETAKHRVFQFVRRDVLPDHKILCVAVSDACTLGVLSSRVHVIWSLAAGGRLGVGNDPIYNKTTCFDPFPFPVCTDAQATRIRELGERLDAHRKARQAAHPDLTLTGVYNVLAKLRSEEVLNPKERLIHEQGLVSILRELHDALDHAVLDAYGWPHDIDDEGILTRLVALNAERAAEERRGLIRWLRPDYQRPLAGEPAAEAPELPGLEVARPVEVAATVSKWPASLSDRIAAVRAALDGSTGALDTEAVARRFKGARRADVAEILESLTALGLAVGLDTAAGRRWRGTRAA